QVSDIDEVNSFSSYQINRWITSIIALVAGILYCTLRNYGPYMTTISMGVYVYKMVDGLADVYEGRLQQADKLYLAA
ncbi:Transcriptional activator, partial [gut metagenome]